jgi:hypothetical protein
MKILRIPFVVMAAAIITLLAVAAIAELGVFAAPRLFVFAEKHTLALPLGTLFVVLGSVVVSRAKQQAMPKQVFKRKSRLRRPVV